MWKEVKRMANPLTHEEFRAIVQSSLEMQADLAKSDKREEDDIEGWMAELMELVEGSIE